MPIYLPPISRRKFLARTLAAGAGLALAPKLLAGDKRPDENLWAFFSDTHIAADRNKVVLNANMSEHLQAVAGEVLALTERPAGVFVVGDCAWNSGEKKDYAAFSRLLEPIRAGSMPVHLTLGNHDNRERFWQALKVEKAAKRPLADRQAGLLVTPQVNWIILDSLVKTLYTPGLLGEAQLAWLAKTLDENPTKPAVILFHHNPGLGEHHSGLKDTEDLFSALRPRKQAKACIFGHTHDWNVTPDPSGLHLVNLPPTAYVFKEGRPSGWVRATVEPDGMRLELRCVNPQHKEHGQVVDLKWRAA